MASNRSIREWVRPAFYLGRNPVTLLGAALTMIGFWLLEPSPSRDRGCT